MDVAKANAERTNSFIIWFLFWFQHIECGTQLGGESQKSSAKDAVQWFGG